MKTTEIFITEVRTVVDPGLKQRVAIGRDEGVCFGSATKVLFLNLASGYTYIVLVIIFQLSIYVLYILLIISHNGNYKG